jgi:hypothetical protein
MAWAISPATRTQGGAVVDEACEEKWTMSTADELAKLQALKDAGTLSEAEFQQAKAKVLSETSPAQQPPTPPPTSSPALVKAPGVVLHKKDVIFLIKRIERCLPYMNEQENKVQTKNLEFFRSTLERNKKVRGNWHTKQPIPGITETRALLSRIETANRLAVGTEPKSSKSTKTPKTSKFSRRGRWSLAIVLVVLIAIIVAVSDHSSTPTLTVAPTTTTAPAHHKIFVAWVNRVRSDLQVCIASTEDVEIALAEMLGTSPTSSDFVTASLAAKNGAPACSMTSSNGILDLGTDNPPNGYPTLSSFSSDISVWADQEDQGVIIDVGKVANSNGNSTQDVTNLISDSQQADADANTLMGELATAAKQAGAPNFTNLGLPIWGITQKS